MNQTIYIPFALRGFNWDWTISVSGANCIKAETPGGLISVAWGIGNGYSVEWGDGSFEDFSTADDVRDRFIDIGVPGVNGV